MTNKITRTVIFEIEPSGDCGKCTSRIVMPRHAFCMAFGEEIRNQCQRPACKDYLAEIKSRVYCDGCQYRVLSCRGNDFNGCELRHPQSVDVDGRYCYNCQDWSE